MLAAHEAADWDRLRELFHPEARIGVFAGGGEPGDPEQAIRDMRRAHGDVIYKARVDDVEELDERSLLLRGRVRYPLPDGGFADAPRFWVYVTRDGLLYRSAVFETEEAALARWQAAPDLERRER